MKLSNSERRVQVALMTEEERLKSVDSSVRKELLQMLEQELRAQESIRKAKQDDLEAERQARRDARDSERAAKKALMQELKLQEESFSGIESAAQSMSQTVANAFSDIITGSDGARGALERLLHSFMQIGVQSFIQQPLQGMLGNLASSFLPKRTVTSGGMGTASIATLGSMGGITPGFSGPIGAAIGAALGGGRSAQIQQQPTVVKNVTVNQSFPNTNPEGFRRSRNQWLRETKQAADNI
jgi:hypothetical protein